MLSPAISLNHALAFMETSFGPLKRLVAGLSSHPERLASLRAEIVLLIEQTFSGNTMSQEFLMTRGVKNR
jgi:hypothetical protein